MKLLVATGLYPPDIGGPATHAVFLEAHLPQRGFTLVMLPYREVRYYPKLLRHLVYTWKLLRASFSCDGIYALDTISVGLPARVVSSLTGKPLILRVPGDYAWEQGQQRFGVDDTLDMFLESRPTAWQVRILFWLQKNVAEHATRVIVPSDYMKSVVEKWGIDASKITRVYTELKEIKVPESKEMLREQYGYTGYVITTAARLVPWKGIEALIRVVAKLHTQGLPVSLTIIGDGTLRKRLEEVARGCDALSYVRFLGAVSHDEVGRRVKASDVFVLNTSYEGMSHHLLEALSLETPIITTPVGGNRELITDSENGLLVPFNDVVTLRDAIEHLYRSPEVGREMARKGVRVVENFHEDTAVEGIVGVFETVWKS
jgi:glycosyltransferase involved in cell wall biosynthesis